MAALCGHLSLDSTRGTNDQGKPTGEELRRPSPLPPPQKHRCRERVGLWEDCVGSRGMPLVCLPAIVAPAYGHARPNSPVSLLPALPSLLTSSHHVTTSMLDWAWRRRYAWRRPATSVVVSRRRRLLWRWWSRGRKTDGGGGDRDTAAAFLSHH